MYESSNLVINQPVVIGIDHGFSLIKTYHHIMSNGVARTSGKPPVLENSLHYDGNYYVIGGNRMTVNEDKTENDNYFILTLAAIADRISNMEGRYVVVDIGSWTKDIVCIDNKRIPEDILQDFILVKEAILPFDVKEIIERQLMEFAHKTEDQLNEYGFDIDYSNIIYVGGGATIMRRFAPDRDNVSYLEDVRVNSDTRNPLRYFLALCNNALVTYPSSFAAISVGA